MANLPIFAVGEYSKIQPAITAGTLKYPAYVFVSDTNQLAFVDKNNDIQLIVGENKKQVTRVEALPEVSDGDTEVLYIYQDIVYVFTGTEYKPMYVDHTADIETLQTSVENLETSVSTLESKVTTLETKTTSLEESVAGLVDGASGLNFSTYSEFPAEGQENQLYIDKTESTGGIYAYDASSTSYIKLSSTESASGGVQFIEL